MFKKILFAAIFMLMGQTAIISAVDSKTSAVAHVNWLTNYDQAVQQAKAGSKPIVLLFTGSDWCGWCTKLEKNVLDTSEFAQAAGDKFIFVKLDFPQYKHQDPKEAEQNKTLQSRYNIHGFPTLIIINANEQKLGETGYLSKTPKEYAAHLIEFVK